MHVDYDFVLTCIKSKISTDTQGQLTIFPISLRYLWQVWAHRQERSSPPPSQTRGHTSCCGLQGSLLVHSKWVQRSSSRFPILDMIHKQSISFIVIMIYLRLISVFDSNGCSHDINRWLIYMTAPWGYYVLGHSIMSRMLVSSCCYNRQMMLSFSVSQQHQK